MFNIRNTIVMMFDSWQFNYTGCYGNDWIKTPNIDRFAEEGVLFENCYGNNMPTLPVRRSMMTGMFTLPNVGWGPLRLQDTTIADLCYGTGVDTALVYNSTVLFVGKSGYNRSYAKAIFSQGFNQGHFSHDELYHYTVDEFYSDPGYVERLNARPDGKQIERMDRADYDMFLRDKQYWLDEEDHTVAVNIRNAIKVLEEADRNHGLHLWIDCWDPHEPWDPPSVWNKDMKCPYDPDYEGADIWMPPMVTLDDGVLTEPQLKHIRALYAEKITLCDKYFGLLCRAMRRLGYEQNTLVWLCSDHGEPLGHGKDGHGLMTKCRPWPYEELVHCPLIIRYPGCPAGTRIKAFVQDCDCAPTLLDWMNIPIPENMTGKSLLPLIRGEVDKVHDFAIAGYYNMSWSIITEDWSFIHWLKKMDEDTSITDMYMSIYTWADHTRTKKRLGEEEVEKFLKKSAEQGRTLDGAAQWTCTPGARVDVPEGDELYDRHTDPFQLNNVIADHPDVARDLLKKLKLYIQDLAD